MGIWFCKPVLDVVGQADAIEEMSTPECGEAVAVPRRIRELDAVICKYSVDMIRHSVNQRLQKVDCGVDIGLRKQLCDDELRGAVDGNNEIRFPFCRAHLV